MPQTGYYKHKSGINAGKYEYWDGERWAGNGQVFNSKEEALSNQRSQRTGVPQMSAGIPQASWQQSMQPQNQQNTANKKGKNKPAKKKHTWVWVLLGILLAVALIGGGVVWYLATTPAQEITGSAKPAPEVNMKVGTTQKGQDEADAGTAANGALSKEQLEEKAKQAEKEGNSAMADYYKTLAKSAPKAEEKATDNTESANLTAAKEIATGISQGQCSAMKDKYGSKLDDTQFPCDGYDANKGGVKVLSDDKSTATQAEEIKLQWGQDKDKQQGIDIIFDASGAVTSALPIKN